MHDGDYDGARYIVWKYRNKKDRLWKSLEKKYDVPVKHAHEWEDEDEIEEKEEPEEVDLDSEDSQDESVLDEKKEEPDL